MLDEGLGSKVQYHGEAAQNKPENITARKLLGSTRARSVAVAQNKPEDITAREFNGQQSPAPRLSCPN